MTRVLLALLIFFAGAVGWSMLSPMLAPNAQLSYDTVVEKVLKIATFIGAGSVVIAFWKRDREARPSKPFRLNPSFTSGLLGGFAGGAVAGLLVGIGYYLQFSSSDQSITITTIMEIFYSVPSAELVLGACILLLILAFRHFVAEANFSPVLFNDVTAGFVGGATGGVFLGMLAVLLFSFRYGEFVGIVPLVIGAITGSIFVASGALFYDYKGRWQNVMRAFTMFLLVVAATATSAIALFHLANGEEWVKVERMPAALVGGALLGIGIGIMTGLQVGLTLVLYRIWPIQEEA